MTGVSRGGHDYDPSRPALERQLAVLHARSDAQPARPAATPLSAEEAAARLKAFRADKLVALDRDKAAFCYQLCRASNARRVVEIGTSFGVSTLYLAAAVRDNIAASGGGDGVVIGTEYEPEKASAARANFAEAGLSRFIADNTADYPEAFRAGAIRSHRLKESPLPGDPSLRSG